MTLSLHIFYKFKNENSADIVLSQAVFSYPLIIAANASVKSAFGLLGTATGSVISMISYIVLFIFLARGLRYVLQRNKKLLILSYLVFAIVFALSLAINSIDGFPTRLIINYNLVMNFATWIPIGCCACSIYDKSILYKIGVNFSYFISIFLFLNFYKNNGTVNEESGSDVYDMSFGFSMMLPIILHFNEFKRNGNILLFCIGFIELLALMAYGNRGALLSVIFFVAISAWLSIKSKTARLVMVLLVMAMATFVISFINEIFFFIVSILPSSFFEHSRTIGMLVAGEMSQESGRDLLRQISYDMIYEKPILGWGLGGEYFEIARRYAGTTGLAVSDAHNPHNGLVQNFLNFGIFIGTFINWLCIRPFFSLGKIKKSYFLDLLIIYCSLNIPRMISAAGFFANPEAAVLLYLFYFSRNKRNE